MLTQEQFNDAIGRVDAEDWHQGRPKMDPLNAVLKDMGLDPIKAADREELWRSGMEEVVGQQEGLEPMPEDSIAVTLLESYSDPLPLHVYGVGSFMLRVGEEAELPADALDALRNANVKFKEN